MKLLFFSLIVLFTNRFYSTHNNPTIDCSKFKKGTFYFRGDEDTSLYKVERNDSIQKETLVKTGDYVTLKISWTGPCDYSLVFLNQHIVKSDSIITTFQGLKLNTQIKRIQGDSCFIESKFENGNIDHVFKGVLYPEK